LLWHIAIAPGWESEGPGLEPKPATSDPGLPKIQQKNSPAKRSVPLMKKKFAGHTIKDF